MSLANYLTFFRLFISPCFMLIYLEYEFFGIPFRFLPYILIILLAISELSDTFDGYVARRLNQVSDLGKILDPMADSVSRIAVFLSFTQPPVSLPLIIVFIFIYRDSVISTLRTICALRGYALAARLSGKIKAVIQAVVCFLILGSMAFYAEGKLSLQYLQSISFWATLITAIYALVAATDYLYCNRSFVSKILHKKES
ncbi:MAG: CDP-alcohol phosphatidyltransferase family protein [Chlamydiae bacterium]|nr:CDP-alcohol phosphatidyltransferase family protein [Chlamydiota bacterium]